MKTKRPKQQEHMNHEKTLNNIIKAHIATTWTCNV